jgi:serine/threonine protein kinase
LQYELVEGPDLLETVNARGAALPEEEAAFYFCQLLKAVLFMHSTGFTHRDIKPENCVLEKRTHMLKVSLESEEAV